MRKIRLGDKVKDKITDLEGVVTGITHYQYGCTQCGVQPKELVDGKVVEAAWIDEPQLEIVKKTKEIKEPKPRYGGIRSHPK